MTHPIGPEALGELDCLSLAAVYAAHRVAGSDMRWPGAQTRILFFTKKSRRGFARTNDGENLFAQWFVYIKGSKGIWLGENGQLYYVLSMSKPWQEAFVRLSAEEAIAFSVCSKDQLIKLLDNIQS